MTGDGHHIHVDDVSALNMDGAGKRGHTNMTKRPPDGFEGIRWVVAHG